MTDTNKFLSFEELKNGLKCEFLALPPVFGMTGMIALTFIAVTCQNCQNQFWKILFRKVSF